MIKNRLIQLQARLWLKKMCSDNVTIEQQKAFVTWIERSDDHKKSYFRQRNAYFKQQAQAKPNTSRPLFTAKFAAPIFSISCILVLLAFITPHIYQQYQAPEKLEQVIASQQNRQVILADGSIIEAKAGSTIDIVYSNELRLIKLIQGEAWFNVAKDTQRPFIVRHNKVAVTALGTAFSVKADPRLQVIVTEHQIKLTMENQPTQYLTQGEGARFEKQQWQQLSPSQITNALAWRNDKLIFDGEPLGYVLAELAPYLTHKTRLVNPAHRDLKVFGSFNTQEAEFALQLIIEGLELKSSARNDKEIIIF